MTQVDLFPTSLPFYMLPHHGTGYRGYCAEMRKEFQWDCAEGLDAPDDLPSGGCDSVVTAPSSGVHECLGSGYVLRPGWYK
jgi:hypothetical protein